MAQPDLLDNFACLLGWVALGVIFAGGFLGGLATGYFIWHP